MADKEVAAVSSGEYLVFLTQDALPVDDHLLKISSLRWKTMGRLPLHTDGR